MPEDSVKNMPNTNTIADTGNSDSGSQPANNQQQSNTQNSGAGNTQTQQNNTINNMQGANQNQGSQATNSINPTDTITNSQSTSSISSVSDSTQAQPSAASQTQPQNTTQPQATQTNNEQTTSSLNSNQPQVDNTNTTQVVTNSSTDKTQTIAGISDTEESNKPTIITLIALLLFYPAGVLIMWLWPKWKFWVKAMLTLPFVIGVTVFALVLFGLIENPLSFGGGPNNLPSNRNTPRTNSAETQLCVNNCIDLYPNRGSGYANCLSTCDGFDGF